MAEHLRAAGLLEVGVDVGHADTGGSKKRSNSSPPRMGSTFTIRSAYDVAAPAAEPRPGPVAMIDYVS